MNQTIRRGYIKGELTVPPDKSISHRAIMFSAIANGDCRIHNFLFAEDCMRTLEAFRAMGVEVTREKDTLTVHGKGLKGLTSPKSPLDLGNSGTSMRVISGILAGQDFTTVLTGDESLRQRPMQRIMDPLSVMEVDIKSAKGGCAPLTITDSGSPLVSANHTMPVASAQVKSCILAAGLYAEGKTSITEPFQSRDHTERMLEYFSADIKRKGLTTEISGMKELVAKDIDIPGDVSSAAFFMLSPLVEKGASLIIRNVGLNPTRCGIMDVLKRMGGDISILNRREGLEPAGDLEIRHSELKGTVVEEAEIPLLIDEVPILAVAAGLYSEGTTEIKGIKELKVKESDRVKSITEDLLSMGVCVKEENNSLIIQGIKGKVKPADLDSFGDHRIAMSMAIAASSPAVCDKPQEILNTDCVNTSYPDFFNDLESIRSI